MTAERLERQLALDESGPASRSGAVDEAHQAFGIVPAHSIAQRVQLCMAPRTACSTLRRNQTWLCYTERLDDSL